MMRPTVPSRPIALLGTKQRPTFRGRRWLARTVVWGVWSYVVAVVVVWLLLRFAGDRWWLATVILFGPRWLCALPLVVLGPAIWLTRLPMWRHLAAAALITFGPIMGFCLPARLTVPDRPTIRVLTCNVKGQCQDNEVLNTLIQDAAPDIVMLQGCWGPARVKWPEGWHGQQYGELLIASRYPMWEFRSLEKMPRMRLLSCVVATPGHLFTICTLHPKSPHGSLDKIVDRWTILRPSRSGQLTEEIEQRWRDSEAMANWLKDDNPEIIAGDFNLPPDSAIYRTFWSGYQNAFDAVGLGFGYTEWPRMRRLKFGIRIDHILTTDDWRPARSWLGPDIGSDHLPLIADLVWTASEEGGEK